MKKMSTHRFSLLLGYRIFCMVILAGLLCFPAALRAVEFEHVYMGDTPTKNSDLPIQESRKSGGGVVSNDDGRLKVSVPVGASHFYTIEGGEGLVYDGSSPAGTTMDFALAVQSEKSDQAAFAIRIGSGKVSWQLTFYPDMIRVGSLMIPHQVNERDTYRLAFRDGKMLLYSARSGELAANIKPETKLSENRISFGTRSSIEVAAPVSWDLGFLRWTNKEAVFSAPVAN